MMESVRRLSSGLVLVRSQILVGRGYRTNWDSKWDNRLRHLKQNNFSPLFSLEPLGAYKDDLVVLELPGNLTVFDINHLAIWDLEAKENLGSVIIPEELNIPPSATEVIVCKTYSCFSFKNCILRILFQKLESRLPNCEQLHQKLQINWEIFGPQITFEIIGQIKKDEYMSFGLSGSSNSSKMLNSDVALVYLETHFGYAQDYNITGAFPVNFLQKNNILSIKSNCSPVYEYFGILQRSVSRYESRRC